MKTVIRSVCIVFAAMLMVWSCKEDDGVTFLPEDEAVAVQFGSNFGSLASLVRPSGLKPLAVGSTWEDNDAIGVFMVDNGTTSVRNAETNKKYITTSGDGTFAPDETANTVYYPINGDKVDFIAYYPYASSITSLGAYSVDVSDQSVPAAIDLLYAKATNNGNGYDRTNASPVALSFGHQLCKLTLNISTPISSTQITAADLADMTVSIAGLNTQAQFDLATGTLGAGSNVADITPCTVTAGAKYEAILLPGSFSDVSVTFGITAGSNPGDYVWNVPNGTFEAGKEYVYSVSFTGTAGNVSVTGAINPWELVTSEIPLTEPADNANIDANLATFPIRFSWTEAPGIVNYKLKFSPLNDFVTLNNFQEITVSDDHYDLSFATCEGLLSAAGVNQNEAIELYWTVVPATAAEVRTYTRRVTVKRAKLALISPDASSRLCINEVSYPYEFRWSTLASETQGYILKFSADNFSTATTLDAGNNGSYTLSRTTAEALFSDLGVANPAQIQWTVEPKSNPTLQVEKRPLNFYKWDISHGTGLSQAAKDTYTHLIDGDLTTFMYVNGNMTWGSSTSFYVDIDFLYTRNVNTVTLYCKDGPGRFVIRLLDEDEDELGNSTTLQNWDGENPHLWNVNATGRYIRVQVTETYFSVDDRVGFYEAVVTFND